MAEISTADPTSMTVTFDELYVLQSGGVDCFVLDWNEAPDLPAYYITVDGRRFGFTGPLRPDHVPTLAGENNGEPGYEVLGRLFAVGYITGLAEGVEKSVPAPA